MRKIKFTFRLPDGPKSPFVVVAGGSDANHDGKVDQNSEVAVFSKTSNWVWERTQDVADPLADTYFAVAFTIGADVRWHLVITDDTGAVRFSSANTTMLPSETVRGRLS
jgi:hypothetical protein